MNSTPIRLALVGSGIFTRTAHIPALNALGKDVIEIAAVYSRRETSARAAADLIPYAVEITTDLWGLLERADIDALDIVLPIGVMEEAVTEALAAGKHVISEKPIAPSVEQGSQMVEGYRANERSVWMVGENYRYKNSLLKAAQVVANGEIGRPLLATFSAYSAFTPQFIYYQTAWRLDGSYPGGLFVDATVHHAAALRLVLGEVVLVSAVGSSQRDDLPGCDTLTAILHFTSGLAGSLNVTFASGVWSGSRLVVCGEEGLMKLDDKGVEVKRARETHLHHYRDEDDVQEELAAFAAAIRSGKPHRNPPEEALKDLAIVEALLQSVDTGSPIRID